jgi:hypothetical protein
MLTTVTNVKMAAKVKMAIMTTKVTRMVSKVTVVSIRRYIVRIMGNVIAEDHRANSRL